MSLCGLSALDEWIVLAGPAFAILDKPRRIEIFFLCPPRKVSRRVVARVFVKMHAHVPFIRWRSIECLAYQSCDLVSLAANLVNEAIAIPLAESW